MSGKPHRPLAWPALTIKLCFVLLPAILLAALLAIAAPAVSAQPPPGPEKITVQPAGVVSWVEMLAAEAAAPAQAGPPAPLVAPYPPAPAPQAIETGLEPVRPAQPPLPVPLAGATLADNFAALGDNNASIPPDTMGAAGPNHLVTMLNTQVRIQDKTGTNLSTVSLSTFWTNGTGLSGSPFDPRVIYDPLSGRWLATIDFNAQSTTSSIGFAISQSSDPTGIWTFYQFDSDGSNATWADFPEIGVNSKWIAITNNMFTVSGNAFQGVKLWVIDKSTALAGGALTTYIYNPGFDSAGGASGFTIRPALTFDATEPALYMVDNFYAVGGIGAPLMRLSRLTGTLGLTPTWQVVSGSTVSAGSGLFALANPFEFGQIDAAQSGTATTVETNDPRIQNAVFRQGRLWATHSGGLPFDGNQGTVNANRTAVFWYELNPAAMPASGDPLVQSGVIDGGSGVHHFFPSLAVNANNEMAIGFSRSDSSKFVEAVMTGRQANDPAGTVDPITVIKLGKDSYVKDFGFGRVRWGDYSATAVDPSDDLTFWSLQEYAETDVGGTANDDRWGTWWGKLAFQVDLALSKTVALTTVNPGQPVTYTVTVANTGPADATGVVVNDPLPLQTAFVSASPSQGSYNSGSGVWNVGNLNNSAVATLSLTVIPPYSAANQTITNTASFSQANQPEINSLNNTAVVTTTVGPAPNLAITKTVSALNLALLKPGQTVTYTIVVANSSSAAANGVQVTDTLPTGVNGVGLSTTTNIGAGSKVTFTLTGIVVAPLGTTITNTAHYSHATGSGQSSAAFTTQPGLYLPLLIKP
jgi:uncharacterized repeat protein (TIGR01451 family)